MPVFKIRNLRLRRPNHFQKGTEGMVDLSQIRRTLQPVAAVLQQLDRHFFRGQPVGDFQSPLPGNAGIFLSVQQLNGAIDFQRLVQQRVLAAGINQFFGKDI